MKLCEDCETPRACKEYMDCCMLKARKTPAEIAQSIERMMSDLVDVLAENPDIEVDQRAWNQLLIYHPMRR